MRPIFLWTVLAGVLGCVATPARAEYNGEFAFGAGYSRVNFDSDSPLIHGRDCLHLDPFVSFSPIERLPQLRLGAAVGFSAALDDTRGQLITSGGETFFVSGSDANLLLFEPELRVSWRQTFGQDKLCFVEAGVAGGGVIAWLSTGNGDASGSGTPRSDFEDTEASWSARAFVRLGIPVTGGIAGLEASYLRGGKMKFADAVRGDLEEYYVGIFGALKF